MNLAAVLLVLLAGAAVGATSIGGILVVPVLTTIAGVPVREAIAASNFSFLFTGAAAIVLQRLLPREALPSMRLVYGAALLGAALGALTLAWLPVALVRLGVAALAIFSGVMALRPSRPGINADTGQLPTRGWTLMAVGAGVGCASAWSGTGGPVLLLPILMLLRVPTALAIAMAQGIQLPIAGSTALVNIASGQLDLRLGLLLGAVVLLGWGVGWWLARRIAVLALRRALAFGLIAVGLAYGWQSL